MAKKSEAPKKPNPPTPTPKKEKVAEYLNAHGCPFSILGAKIENGFKLSKEQKENELFMKKFNHAIEIGYIKKG